VWAAKEHVFSVRHFVDDFVYKFLGQFGHHGKKKGVNDLVLLIAGFECRTSSV
jgi:hypothetical protein